MNFDRFGFKAKRVNSKKWLYAGFDNSEELLRWLLRDENNSKYDPAWIDPKTICQCTGIRDSDGRLIYENDILEIEALDENKTGQVYYQELDCSFRVWLPLYTTSIQALMSLAEMTSKKVRVIGNKFDKEVENDKNLH